MKYFNEYTMVFSLVGLWARCSSFLVTLRDVWRIYLTWRFVVLYYRVWKEEVTL